MPNHDDPVGYGRPPAHSRFKPGQSGNPNGRPRKSRYTPPDPASEPSKAAVLATALRPRRIRDGGKVREISTSEAIMEAIAQKAMGGSRLHAKMLLEEIRAHESEARRERLEQYRFWAARVAESRRLLDAASAAGLPPPAVYPHPDDVTFGEPHEPVIIKGPRSASEAELHANYLAAFKLVLRIGVYNQLYYRRPGRKEPTKAARQATRGTHSDPMVPMTLLLSNVIGRLVPPSMRMDGDVRRAFVTAESELSEAELRKRILADLNSDAGALTGLQGGEAVPRVAWGLRSFFETALAKARLDEPGAGR